MNNISILDCTLRDGGYINEWNFGNHTIHRIIDLLEQSNIDIIECGFLRDVPYNENCSVYSTLGQIVPFIPFKKKDTMYVAMIALGDIDVAKIPPYNGESIDGIRLTFHRSEWDEVFLQGKHLQEKGYKVFIQPVGTTTYTDAELLQLVERVNELQPFAFYIVDTLGAMYQNELLRTFHIIDHNLHPGILIGFHSHNNLQLSFANAQSLLMLHTKREIILDASVFGMGRGAGNLCTELIAQYININMKSKYDVTPLLEIVDNYLLPIFNMTPWGYSVPYYLAAANGIHPNYATYLMNKQTINIKKINTIMNIIPDEQRDMYNKEIIEKIYLEFQSHMVDDRIQRQKIHDFFNAHTVLVLAPGSTIQTHRNTILKFIEENHPVIITVNFVTDLYKQNILFISNSKRFSSISQLPAEADGPIIVTSNIMQQPTDGRFLIVDYLSLIGNGAEADNAGVMLINLLESIHVAEVHLAGFDGFSLNLQESFALPEMVRSVEKDAILARNDAIKDQFNNLQKKIKLRFLTPSIYQE